ncbi:MAG: hypothetical protein QME96_06300 [Myxococcota bacterium]|nr:hypothetical protein [Myxococcota bacterium]
MLDEAQQVCGRAFRSPDRIEEARAACGRRISGLREGLGLDR